MKIQLANLHDSVFNIVSSSTEQAIVALLKPEGSVTVKECKGGCGI